MSDKIADLAAFLFLSLMMGMILDVKKRMDEGKTEAGGSQ